MQKHTNSWRVSLVESRSHGLFLISHRHLKFVTSESHTVNFYLKKTEPRTAILYTIFIGASESLAQKWITPALTSPWGRFLKRPTSFFYKVGQEGSWILINANID